MRLIRFCMSIFSIALIICSCNTEEQPIKAVKPTPPLQSLKNIVEKYPDSLLLVHELIEAYRNEGYYEAAIALTDEQIKKDSGNAYLWNIKATLFFENEDTAKAIYSLKQAIKIFPLPSYLVALGTIYAELKNPEALDIANTLLVANGERADDDAYFIKGLYYNFKEMPKKAIPFFDSTLQLDYTYMYAYREKGIALYHLGKYKEAIAVLKKAVTLQNNFDAGYYWLGRCYEKLNKRQDAIQSYQNALLYDAGFLEAREALEKIQQESQ